MAHNFARFSLFFLSGSLFFSHIQKESRFRPCSGCSSLCKISFCCRGSVAVAAVLAYQPVLTQALGFLHTAADAVEQPSLQRAVRIADLRHSICIPERLPSFLSRHQTALLHDFSLFLSGRSGQHNVFILSRFGRGGYSLFPQKAPCFLRENVY